VTRVLFVEQWSELGGGQRLLMDLVDYLQGRGVTCAVAFPSRGPVRDELERRSVRTFDFALPALSGGKKSVAEKTQFLMSMPRASTAIAKAARRFRADLVFANGGRAIPPAVMAGRRARIPVVCMVQLVYGGAERLLLRWCFTRPQVASVTFCSSIAAAPFSGLEKGHIVPNWVSPQFLERPVTRREDRPPLRVGVLGRLSPTKGQGLFLEALLPLLEERPELELAIGGTSDFERPEEKDRLHEIVRRHQHRDRVTFAGAVDAIAFLDTLDILVVPSLWEEPFGLVAVEGMARQLPVVATRSGTLPEIVQASSTGLVVDRSAAALRSAVNELAENRRRRLEMGLAGRRRVVERYNPETQMRLVHSAIDAAAAGGPASVARRRAG
jgi:glycosyltransferase involved in cell wall biosynthesis